MSPAALWRSGANPEAIQGNLMRARLPTVAIGEVCHLWRSTLNDEVVGSGVVVGIEGEVATVSMLTSSAGLSPSMVLMPTGRQQQVRVGAWLLGSVLDGLGRCVERMDGKGLEPPVHMEQREVASEALDYRSRRAVDSCFATGVRAVDALLTIGKGQRVGVFAAAGSGKTTFAEMLLDRAYADVFIIALIGERGREVASFVERISASSNAARTIIVQATSDAPPATRSNAAQLATALAEYFRDQGSNVLLVMDSMTRYARALRDVALLAGEPPARRGYPASVFEAMPRLLERPGNTHTGSITAFYTVLLEDEEEADPIGEEVKSLLDGHIHLSAKLAGRGHYPAIDMLRSGSRLFNQLASVEHAKSAIKVRAMIAELEDMQLMRDLGEYRQGSNAQLDRAVSREHAIEMFLRQGQEERVDPSQALEALNELAR